MSSLLCGSLPPFSLYTNDSTATISHLGLKEMMFKLVYQVIDTNIVCHPLMKYLQMDKYFDYFFGFTKVLMVGKSNILYNWRTRVERLYQIIMNIEINGSKSDVLNCTKYEFQIYDGPGMLSNSLYFISGAENELNKTQIKASTYQAYLSL